MEPDFDDTGGSADIRPGGWGHVADDDDYTTVMLLAAGLMRIERERALAAAGVRRNRTSAEDGLLPTPWRAAMVRLWWRFRRAGMQPPESDLELMEMCRRPFGEWPVQLRLSAADQELSLLDGDALGPLAEQAVSLMAPDVEAELVEHRIYGELMKAAEVNASDLDGAQANYVVLRRLLVDNPVLPDHEVRRVGRTFPAAAASGQPFVYGLVNAAYVRRPAEGRVTLRVCDGCGNPVEDSDPSCGTAGCSGRPSAREIEVLGAYYVQHRAARRFIHDPGLLEARLLDGIAARTPVDAVSIEAWPGLDAYDIRLSFAADPASGRRYEVWGADAKDQVSPTLLGKGFRWKPDPPCDRRFLVLPLHRAHQPGYVQDLVTELEGRVSGVTVIDENTFIAMVLDRTRHEVAR